jgi:hypothetical protein
MITPPGRYKVLVGVGDFGSIVRYDEDGLRSLCGSINTKLGICGSAEIIGGELWVTLCGEPPDFLIHTCQENISMEAAS